MELFHTPNILPQIDNFKIVPSTSRPSSSFCKMGCFHFIAILTSILKATFNFDLTIMSFISRKFIFMKSREVILNNFLPPLYQSFWSNLQMPIAGEQCIHSIIVWEGRHFVFCSYRRRYLNSFSKYDQQGPLLKKFLYSTLTNTFC